MQGMQSFIPTQSKIAYINQLLKVGFDTIDFGSFVSPRAVPQMRDTTEVLAGLDRAESASKLLAIVANLRGAQQAVDLGEINYLGFPLSLSETFQQRNTNKSIEQALQILDQIQSLCTVNGMELVTYLSMGFGNPYNDAYHPDLVVSFVDQLNRMELRIISLADTIGVSNPINISELFQALIPAYPHIEFGAHLHAQPQQAKEKVIAAYDSGCRRFDGALKGFGGCPMADDHLVGNIPTEVLLQCLQERGVGINLDTDAMSKSLKMIGEIF